MDSYSKFRNIIPCTSPGVAFAVTIYRETYRLTSGQYHGFVGSILGHLYVCYKLASYTTTCKIQTNFDYTNELSTFFSFQRPGACRSPLPNKPCRLVPGTECIPSMKFLQPFLSPCAKRLVCHFVHTCGSTQQISQALQLYLSTLLKPTVQLETKQTCFLSRQVVA